MDSPETCTLYQETLTLPLMLTAAVFVVALPNLSGQLALDPHPHTHNHYGKTVSHSAGYHRGLAQEEAH
ncbi:uncharacterized [Tachysurus ichikawai]